MGGACRCLEPGCGSLPTFGAGRRAGSRRGRGGRARLARPAIAARVEKGAPLPVPAQSVAVYGSGGRDSVPHPEGARRRTTADGCGR